MNLKDVVIVGAGAAGASAAFHLANLNKSVILLDKSEHTSIKPCGGGMAASVQNFFPFNLSPIVDEVIKTVEFSWCLSDPVIANLPGTSPFWITRREKLDEFIIENALKKGAEMIKPFKVSDIKKEHSYWVVSSEDGDRILAKAVIIADGSNSPWPKLFDIGPKKLHYALTTSVRLNRRGLIKEGTSRFEFGLVHHGFAWAFPLKNSVNIGVGTFIGQSSSNTETILAKLLPSLGFQEHEGIRSNSLLRVWNGHSKLHNNEILVIGDAASLCDPFLAEGLRPALMSGKEAATCINSWLEGKADSLDSYTRNMKLNWGNSMAWGRRISQAFYRFPKIGYQLGIKRPTAPERIAQILSGEMSYADIAQRVIKRLILKR